MFVREEYNARRLVSEDFGDNANGFFPMRLVILARFGVNFFETVWFGLDQTVANVVAGAFEFFEARRLAFFVAALGDGDVDDVEMGFAHDAKRQRADDAFVVGMWRKYEGARRILINFRAIERREAAEWGAFASVKKFGVLLDEMVVWIHLA